MMKKLKHILPFILFFSVLGSSFGQDNNFDGVYSGNWGDTNFKYTFKNGLFTYDVCCHYGYNKTIGSYEVKRNKVILNSIDSLNISDSVSHWEIIDRVFILKENKGCVIDVSDGSAFYDYCENRVNNSKEYGETIDSSKLRRWVKIRCKLFPIKNKKFMK